MKKPTKRTSVMHICCTAAAVTTLVVIGAGSAAAQGPDAAASATSTSSPTAPVSPTPTPTPTPTPSQSPEVPASVQKIDPAVYSEMFKILFAVFAIALVLESALAVIFNWRLFLVYFDSRGAKTIVSMIAGIVIAVSLQLDLVDRLYKAMFAGTAQLGGFGYFLTGLVLAGGSSGVNNILKGLGFRSLQSEEAKLPRPKPTEAWLAVRLKRKRSQSGPVQVFLSRDGQGERLIGTILGTTAPKFLTRLRTNPMRYPTVAGFPVPADSTVMVQLRDPALERGQDMSDPWGPYTVAGGAIIDFDLEL